MNKITLPSIDELELNATIEFCEPTTFTDNYGENRTELFTVKQVNGYYIPTPKYYGVETSDILDLSKVKIKILCNYFSDYKSNWIVKVNFNSTDQYYKIMYIENREQQNKELIFALYDYDWSDFTW